MQGGFNMHKTSPENASRVETVSQQLKRLTSASTVADRGEAGDIDKPSEQAEIPNLSKKRTQAPGASDTEERSSWLETLAHTTTTSTQVSEANETDGLLQKSQQLAPAPSIAEVQLSQTQSTDSILWSETRGGPHSSTSLFRESKISIAVDVSGSTYGAGLTAEVRAIRDICSLFPRPARSDISILPWSDYAAQSITLNDLDELDPDGGTKPSVLLNDADCRYKLQRSSFWCLMTDGDVLDPDVRQFARELVEYGLHSLACVIAIFGEREQTPANCNVSVGLSVFAVSPHCAFLYTDIESNETYVLQTKGCFSTLLPKGKSNPKLTSNG